MYEGLQALARLDDATLVRDETGMLKKAFMSQLQDLAAGKPMIQPAPMPPQMSQPVYKYEAGGRQVDGDSYVFDADFVSTLGNGSTEAGARILDETLPKPDAEDDSFGGLVKSKDGDGMSDDVMFKVENGGDIGAAAISGGEYIAKPSQTEAAGQGDADKGVEAFDKLREEIRTQARGNDKQQNELANAALTVRDILRKA